ncbi:MAG TPA: glycosyltransferase [Anaeromyxobacteraceae bacterium]|nr:glycosyltransferase [Anaeromyxobacteraceae bacterium]
MPRVAVLMPARDAGRTVRAAAVSILRQTVRDLALVAVEDGSRDATPDVLRALAARDRRVVVVPGPGQGIAGALQRGLSRCDAEVVARMDADDVAFPRRLERQLDLLDSDASLQAVGSRVRLFPRRAVAPGMRRYAEWLNGLVSPALVERDLYVESPIAHPAAAIRREALEGAGGWRDGDFPEDYDLWLRIAAGGGRLSNAPEVLLDWRESSARLTRVDPRYGVEKFLSLKARHLAAGPLAGHREVALWGAGETGRALARALGREGVAVALFVEVDPKKMGRRVLGAEVISFDQVERVRGLPLLVAVGAPRARDLIRAELARRGFEELRDYRCAA